MGIKVNDLPQRFQDQIRAEFGLGSAKVVSPCPVGNRNYEIKPSTDEAKLNKTERAYLAYLRSCGLHYVGIQNITLKLGDDCRFTPDFNTIEGGRFVFHETKGFMRDDALVKLKVAARQFSMFDFVLVKKSGVSWDIQPIRP